MDELINGTLQRLPFDDGGRWSNVTSVLPTIDTATAGEETDFPDETSRFSRPLLTFAAVATITIMVTGIVGNLLTIVALLRCPKVRNVAAAFIISLCIADCLFCIIVLPFNAMRFIQGTWMHGETLCTLITFMQYGSVGVSLLCITMISINRYIMIAHYSIYPKVYKTSWIMVMIVACWLFSYGFQLPTLFGVWGKFGYNHQLGTCSILPDDEGRSSKTAMFIIAFIIPCMIIVICYSRIFCVVHKSDKRMKNHSKSQCNIPNNLRSAADPASPLSAGSSSSANNNSISYTASSSAVKVAGAARTAADARDAKARRNEWRITKMVLAIFLSFVMCYLPITISKIVDKNVSVPVLHIIGYIMLYLSACINPIIYVIMNKQYRQAYKTVIFCKPSRLLGFGGSSVGEKWKDIGYSYNHSRTMVSQVSIAEPESPPSSRLRQDSPHPQHLVAIQDS
ncbi:G-protein coupled receptor moody isoform X1 [Anopheles gambiae]|uniref:G-protein coupled receptor moody-like isoform X1 n=1 Tax=Anopheles coluzzii TaxID=1518534 RepID=UPI001AAC5274|nr:G-protein coupled receptor moody-like isoform X1 [Anopheles coluzzii]XP_061497903.1 G-protein coupled receptor moody isoform X1 [Anopheles gambiae]